MSELPNNQKPPETAISQTTVLQQLCYLSMNKRNSWCLTSWIRFQGNEPKLFQVDFEHELLILLSDSELLYFFTTASLGIFVIASTLRITKWPSIWILYVHTKNTLCYKIYSWHKMIFDIMLDIVKFLFRYIFVFFFLFCFLFFPD